MGTDLDADGCPSIGSDGGVYSTLSSLPAGVRALGLTFPDPCRITPKQLAESFVSGHTGVADHRELALLMATVGMWMAIHRIVAIILRAIDERARHRGAWTPISSAAAAAASTSSSSSFFARVLPSFLFDYCLMIAPVVLGMTLWADHVETIFVLQLLALVLLVGLHRAIAGEWCVPFFSARDDPAKATTKAAAEAAAATLQRMNQLPKAFITNYRTSLMIGTSVAILAVDFVFFPRRYCKTENFGLGMMDAGVGSFIISHALTSIHARQGGGSSSSSRGSSASKSTSSGAGRSILHQLLHILRSIAPLLFLGVARLFTIKSLDYQQHVSEYGVHWNFFFTLAAVAVLSGGLSRAIHPRTTLLFGAAILVVYQAALSTTGLTEYLLGAPRLSLFSANKEGLVSSVGYFALYLISVRAGYEVLQAEATLVGWWRKIAKLIAIDLLLWCVTAWTSRGVQAPSRRMVNLAYAAWMLALNLLLLIEFMLLEMIICERRPRAAAAADGGDGEKKGKADQGDSSSSSLIVSAINRNSLPFFLLCNLCTGAVNLSMSTILASDAVALAVVLSYTFVACLAIVYVDFRGWIIKL